MEHARKTHIVYLNSFALARIKLLEHVSKLGSTLTMSISEISFLRQNAQHVEHDINITNANNLCCKHMINELK